MSSANDCFYGMGHVKSMAALAGLPEEHVLRKVFTDEQVVQLVFAICHFNTMNRLADAFGVPLEEGNVFERKWAPPEAAPEPQPAEAKDP